MVIVIARGRLIEAYFVAVVLADRKSYPARRMRETRANPAARLGRLRVSRSAGQRHACEIRELPDHRVLLRDDEAERVDLLLECHVVLAEIVQPVAELNDLFAHGHVRSTGRTSRARQGDEKRADSSAHGSSSFDEG